MSEWIKAADRLPEKNGAYIVFAKSQDPAVPLLQTAWFFVDKQEWGLVKVWSDAVSYWMEMPFPPEEV